MASYQSVTEPPRDKLDMQAHILMNRKVNNQTKMYVFWIVGTCFHFPLSHQANTYPLSHRRQVSSLLHTFSVAWQFIYSISLQIYSQSLLFTCTSYLSPASCCYSDVLVPVQLSFYIFSFNKNPTPLLSPHLNFPRKPPSSHWCIENRSHQT